MAGTPVAPAGQWTAAPNNVLAGSAVATDSAAGQAAAFRGLVAADLPALAQNFIGGLVAGIRAAASSATVTGTLAINSGLTTVANVCITLRGLPSSSAQIATWSPLASTGWFSALVFAVATATNVAPAASTLAQTVDWIAIGS